MLCAGRRPLEFRLEFVDSGLVSLGVTCSFGIIITQHG